MSPLTKFLAIFGVFLIMLAFAWPYIPTLPIGRLPGDITTMVGSVRVYLPFGTALAASLFLTIILWALQKF